MSIALDLALMLRENHILDSKGKIIHISAAVRGFLHTLSWRVGSDPYSWVSQEKIAQELDMSLIGIKKLCAKALKTGLIEVMQAKDKRKNLYRPADFLINYHQKRRSKIVDNSRFKPKIGIQKDTYSSEIGIQKDTYSSEIGIQKDTYSADPKEVNSLNNNEKPDLSTDPKGHKDKGTIKDKETEGVFNILPEQDLPTWLGKEIWDDYKTHRKEMKKPLTALAEKKAIKLLEDLKQKGNDIEQVINNSIANGWQGLFEIKTQNKTWQKSQATQVKPSAGNKDKNYAKCCGCGNPPYECACEKIYSRKNLHKNIEIIKTKNGLTSEVTHGSEARSDNARSDTVRKAADYLQF